METLNEVVEKIDEVKAIAERVDGVVQGLYATIEQFTNQGITPEAAVHLKSKLDELKASVEKIETNDPAEEVPSE